MDIGGRRWLVVTTILGALATTAIALAPPATGYEPSIYSAYPLWMQALFALALVGAVVAALRGAANEDKHHWLSAMGVVFGLYAVLFALPAFRQYVLFGRGSFDTLAHLGYIKTIVDTGHWAQSDWYPLVHIIGAIFEFIGVPRNAIVAVFQSAFFPVFALSVFLYTRRIIDERTGMFASIGVLPLIFGPFHATIHPFLLSFFIFPLALFASHHRRRRWALPAGVLLLALIPFHPLTAGIAVGYLAISGALSDRFRSVLPGPSATMFLAGSVILTMWYLGFQRIERVIASLFVATTITPPSGGSSGALTLGHAVIRGIEIYGDVALIAGMALVASIIIAGRALWRWRSGGGPTGHVPLLAYTAIGFALGIGLFVGPMSNPIRTSRYFLLFGTIGLAATIPVVLDHPARGTQILAGLAVVGLVAATVVGAGGIYPNGNHLTAPESESVNWTLDHTNTDPILSLQMSRKMTLAQTGFHGSPEKWRFQKYNPSLQLPSHLGYSKHRTIAKVHEPPFYVLTKAHDTEYYQASYREQWSSLTWYSERDLRRLRADPAANRIYSAGFGKASGWRVAEELNS